MIDHNGEDLTIDQTPPPEPPTIKVHWHEDQQVVAFTFEAKEFKTWDFVIAVLGMAKAHAEELKRQAIQQAQLREMQVQSNLRRQLDSRGPGRPNNGIRLK